MEAVTCRVRDVTCVTDGPPAEVDRCLIGPFGYTRSSRALTL